MSFFATYLMSCSLNDEISSIVQNSSNQGHSSKESAELDATTCSLKVIECPNEKPGQMIRTVTAYNTVKEQTDGNPCISANGTDICKGMQNGKHYVATNELAFGTKVKISGTIYEVVDRTNARYTYRYDIAFGSSPEQLKAAKDWGRKDLPIEIVK